MANNSPDNVKNLDNLSESVKSIESELNSLKGHINTKEKIQSLKSNANGIRDKITDKIEELERNSDKKSQTELEQAHSLLNTLDGYLTDIESLYKNTTADTQALMSEVTSSSTEDKKGGITNRISEQRQDIWDGEKWKNETGKNLLRTTGFVTTGIGAIKLLVKGCKKLFGKDEDKSESSEEEKEEKKGKKTSGWKKFLKGTLIGSAIYYIGHGIATGKRNYRDFFNWNKDKRTESTKIQIDAYDKLSIEQKEQYNKLGNTINDFYGNLRDKEVNLGYKNTNTLGTFAQNISLKDGNTTENYEGLVPFCIDSGINSIEELLSEKDLNECAFNKNYNDLKNKIKGWSTEKLEKILGPFVSKLNSFSIFGKKTGLSLGEQIKEWLNYNENSREIELTSFFRQYTKVLSFAKDKEKSLQYIIAENEIKKHGYKGNSLSSDEDDKLDLIEEALDDEERYNTNIKNNTTYKQFMNSKLLSCTTILEENNLMNSESSPILKKTISKLDKETDSLLQVEDGNTILDRGLAEISGGLTDGTKNDIIEMCNDVKDDITNESGTGFMQEYLDWISYACNMDDSNKETFLQESGLSQLYEGYILTIDEYREKIKRGEITKQELEELKNISLAYIAFKKEMNIAIHTMGSIKAENPDALGRILNSSIRIVNGFGNSLTNIISGKGKFGDRVGLGITISVIGTSIYIIKHPKKILIGTMKGTLNCIGWIALRPGLSTFGLEKHIKALTNTTEKKSYFLHYVLNGEYKNENRLLKIAREHLGIDENNLAKVLSKIDLGLEEDEAKILLKYAHDKKIRKLCITEEISKNSSIRDQLLHKKTARKFEVTLKNKEFIKEIKKIDSNIESLNKGVKDTTTSMLRKIDNIDDIRYLSELTENSEFINNIGNLSKNELKQFRRCTINDLKIIQQKIASGEIRTISEYLSSMGKQIDTISETQKIFNTTIDNAIARFKELGDTNFSKTCIEKLENLKRSNDLTDEAMESLIKFTTKNRFPVEDLPDLIKMFKINEKFGKEGKALGQHLQELLEAGKYSEFKGIIKDPNLSKFFKNIKLKKITTNFIQIEKNLFKNINEMSDFMKITMKVIAKIL